MVNVIKEFYQNVRNTLVWFMVYFLLQAVIWISLAVLILVYPQALYVLVSIFFIVLAVVSFYFACVLIKYIKKLKGVKDKLTGDFK